MAMIQVIRDNPPGIARCRASDCRRQIEWVLTTNGKKLPVDHPMQIVMETQTLDGVTLTYINTDSVHWGSCPTRAQFSRKQRGER
jgi:hypothetical protein